MSTTIDYVEHDLDARAAPSGTYIETGSPITGTTNAVYGVDGGRYPVVGVALPARVSDIGLDSDDLRQGVVVGDVTGELVLPIEPDVRIGVGYGADGTEFEGTLAPGVARSRIQKGM